MENGIHELEFIFQVVVDSLKYVNISTHKDCAVLQNLNVDSRSQQNETGLFSLSKCGAKRVWRSSWMDRVTKEDACEAREYPE